MYVISHIKTDSTMSKVRPVYDMSAVSTSGSSLNDLLHTGPKLQDDPAQIFPP